MDLVLFTTPTCPNCKIAKKYFDQHGIKYTTIDATTRGDLVEKYHISSAPTLVALPHNAKGNPVVVSSLPEILKFAK